MDVEREVNVLELQPGSLIGVPGGSRKVKSVASDGKGGCYIVFADSHVGHADRMLFPDDEKVPLIYRPMVEEDRLRLLRDIFRKAGELDGHEPCVCDGESADTAAGVIDDLRKLCEAYLLTVPVKDNASPTG